MNTLLMLHILALGIWIGVIAAEFVIEWPGMKDDHALLRAARLHYATDIGVEIPAFVTVLVTGLLMLGQTPLEGVLLYKIGFGLLAIAFNVFCVYAVFKRRALPLERIHQADGLMRLSGAGFIPSFVLALLLGLYLAISH